MTRPASAVDLLLCSLPKTEDLVPMPVAASPRCLHTRTWLRLPRTHRSRSPRGRQQQPRPGRTRTSPAHSAHQGRQQSLLALPPDYAWQRPLPAASLPPPWHTRPRCTWTSSLLCPRPAHPQSHRPLAALHPNRTARPRGLCCPFPCPRLSAQRCAGLPSGLRRRHPGSPTPLPHFPHDSTPAVLHAD